MQAIADISNRVKLIDVNVLMYSLFKNAEFRKLIVDLNFFEQLGAKGVDAKGNQLEQQYTGYKTYSPKTIKLKKEFGRGLGAITDHITLYDTGEFYKSGKVEFKDGSFIITADTIKDDTDLIDAWGEDILGLNEESLSELRQMAIEIIIPTIQRKILGV